MRGAIVRLGIGPGSILANILGQDILFSQAEL